MSELYKAFVEFVTLVEHIESEMDISLIYIYIQGVQKKRSDNFLTIKRSNVDGFLKFLIIAASK